MSRESALQYFSRKAGVTLWIVGILGLCMVYVGYAGQRRSVIFMAVGVALAALCAYELIHDRRHAKKGSDLDKMAEAALSGWSLRSAALEKLCLDSSDAASLESVSLRGYCTAPIRTRPYFRRDEEDGRLRSSNYQASLLLFGAQRFYTYSRVLSLVDKENAETGRLWRYEEVAEARLVSEEFSFYVGTDEEKRGTAPVTYLLLKDSSGRSYTFSFDGAEDGPDRARSVLEKLSGCIDGGGEPPEAPLPSPAPAAELPSAARGRDLQVGLIGDTFQEPRK